MSQPYSCRNKCANDCGWWLKHPKHGCASSRPISSLLLEKYVESGTVASRQWLKDNKWVESPLITRVLTTRIETNQIFHRSWKVLRFPTHCSAPAGWFSASRGPPGMTRKEVLPNWAYHSNEWDTFQQHGVHSMG